MICSSFALHDVSSLSVLWDERISRFNLQSRKCDRNFWMGIKVLVSVSSCLGSRTAMNGRCFPISPSLTPRNSLPDGICSSGPPVAQQCNGQVFIFVRKQGLLVLNLWSRREINLPGTYRSSACPRPKNQAQEVPGPPLFVGRLPLSFMSYLSFISFGYKNYEQRDTD